MGARKIPGKTGVTADQAVWGGVGCLCAGDGQSRFKCLKFLEEKHLFRQFETRQAARYQHIVQAEGLSTVNFVF